MSNVSPAMASREERQEVVTQLLGSWPSGAPRVTIREQILIEIERFLVGEGASLPFRTRDSVAWVTVAPTSAALQQEFDALQAWLLPSYGWLDGKQPFVVPGEASGSLAAALLSYSPGGYVRWRCDMADFSLVSERLRTMRQLSSRRPAHLRERVPSLLELRQQFRTALLTGDWEAGEATLRAIDHYQLDSAVNTQMMRVRLLDQFGEFSAIVEDTATDRLLGLRVPPSVRSALIRAFMAVHVAPRLSSGAGDAALGFRDHVYPRLAGLLAVARATDGPEVASALGYRAWVTRDERAASELLATADEHLRPLLQEVLDAASPESPVGSVGEAFRTALSRGDLRALQDLAPSVLTHLERGSAPALAEAAAAIVDSLDVRANPELSRSMEQSGMAPAVPRVPQSWRALLERVREGDLAGAERFLALDEGDRPSPEHLTSEDREAAVFTLEELLTSPQLGTSASRQWVADVALPALIDDFVGDAHFPRSDRIPIYLQLLRLWADHKKGTVYPPDAQLTLLLGAAVLQHSAGHQVEVSGLLVSWWEARPHRAALPFLLGAIELILDYTSEFGAAQQLWIEGASLAARDPERLVGTERYLWRRLGKQVGFDPGAVDEVLPTLAEPKRSAVETDVLRDAGLRRIAIVSLHRRAADEACALLAERTGAEVFVVDEKVPGTATRAAQSADVVLFVWAATKHAVFRAFDAMRNRVAYVQGTGAGSIVLALERWAMRT
ncbi:MAG: hypothetical protein ACK51E_02735 [Gemmatimonadota bacterium]